MQFIVDQTADIGKLVSDFWDRLKYGLNLLGMGMVTVYRVVVF